MTAPIEVWAEPTPNPNALKFTLNRSVTEGRSKTYASPEAAEASPLAKQLFQIAGVKSLFFLNNFITVTRQPGSEWATISRQVEERIRAHYAS
ncbi:MAG TPA: NifU N-terminal domain-containing protein [Dehalococcoidia bacterium]|nr:NifU N-terminal domain-containing protein [Dehalococcoidia bacterium]